MIVTNLDALDPRPPRVAPHAEDPPPLILQHRARLDPVVERAADALDAVATRADALQRQLLAEAYGGDGSAALAAGHAVATWEALRALGDDRIHEHTTGAEGVSDG